MDTIKVGGKAVPFYFSWSAVKKLSNLVGEESFHKVLQIALVLPIEYVEHIVLFGLEGGAAKAKTKDKFSLEEVERWLEEDWLVPVRAAQLIAAQVQKSEGVEDVLDDQEGNE